MILSVLKIIKSIYYLFSNITEDYMDKILESDYPIIKIVIFIILFIITLLVGIPLGIYMFILFIFGFKSCRTCEKYIYPFEQKVKIYEIGYGYGIESNGWTDYYHKVCK